MKHTWNAQIYSQFLGLRTRPARDLLGAIPLNFSPKVIYDLGCGPGNSTILLKERWPQSEIIGLDSSEDMLKQARTNFPDVHFERQNIEDFAPVKKADCIFANASLQWVDSHETVIPRLFDGLNSGGVLAIQMSNNFHCATHQVTVQLLKNNSRWHNILKGLRFGELKKPLYHPSFYYDLFTQSEAKNIQIWETEYFQELNNHGEIFDWVNGTGLRPVLLQMDAENQDEFEKHYIEEIAKEYPIQTNGKILLPFKRIFMLGFKD